MKQQTGNVARIVLAGGKRKFENVSVAGDISNSADTDEEIHGILLSVNGVPE